MPLWQGNPRTRSIRAICRLDAPSYLLVLPMASSPAPSPYLVPPGKPFNLADIDPSDTGRFSDKEEAEQDTRANLDHLIKLQELLYADARRSLLVVFQAMDAGGKDGAIEQFFRRQPAGVQLVTFKSADAARAGPRLPLAHPRLRAAARA